MVKLFQVQLEHYEKVQGDVLSLEGKANQLGQLVRANLPAAMQGFVVVPLFAGYDQQRAAAAGCSPTTSPAAATKRSTTRPRVRAACTPATGSRRAGARACRSTRPIDLAIRALFAAADEDVATGGPDLVRGIFPTVAVIDADASAPSTDDEVAERSQTPPARPGAGR